MWWLRWWRRRQITWRFTIGPVTLREDQPEPGLPGTPATGSEALTVQLTSDQQTKLNLSGQDFYGNEVEITGRTVWSSSDPTIVQLVQSAADDTMVIAQAVGPTGSAAVTATNDVNHDGTGDFIGSIAIDVVAGVMTEIAIVAGTPTDKPA